MQALRTETQTHKQPLQQRLLENSYYEATKRQGTYGKGESCEIEIENKLFVQGRDDLYVASDALVDWYSKSFYNSRADDIIIIIDHD